METLCLLLLTAGLVGSVLALQDDLAQPSSRGEEKAYYRILNGQASFYSEHPYLCSLQYKEEALYYHTCGSVIYNSKIVITAAHCLVNKTAEILRVVCGDFVINKVDGNEQFINIKQIISHEWFINDGKLHYPNDIALLELEYPLTFNKYVNSIPIAAPSTILPEYCQIMGWGRTGDSLATSNELRKVTMHRLETSECQTFWGKLITDDNICFHDKEQPDTACMGDSGGPAVCGEYAVGVLSFVSTDKATQRCLPSYPNVFTRLSTYADWVEKHAFHICQRRLIWLCYLTGACNLHAFPC